MAAAAAAPAALSVATMQRGPVRPGVGRIGPYELLAEVHQDSLGLTATAKDTELGIEVLVNLLDLDLANRDPELTIPSLQRSVLAAASVQHPGLARIHDAGVHGGRVYIVHRDVIGRRMSKALASGWQLPPLAAARLVRDLAAATAHAHSHGVLHGGINPSNVVLAFDDRPILLGLGYARIDHVSDLPSVHPLVGDTVAYLAPEQVQGGELDARTDVHALGMLLYELLTGRRAHAGATVPELAHSLLTHDPGPPHWLRLGISERLSAIAMQALQRNPAARYARAVDMLAALNVWLEQSGQQPAADDKNWLPEGAADRLRKRILRQWGEVLGSLTALARGFAGSNK